VFIELGVPAKSREAFIRWYLRSTEGEKLQDCRPNWLRRGFCLYQFGEILRDLSKVTNCIRMLHPWFVNLAFRSVSLRDELIAPGASANSALRSAATPKWVPGPRYLTESVNYHMETMIIWKNINDWSFHTYMVFDELRHAMRKKIILIIMTLR
jgi:hypothetical protein